MKTGVDQLYHCSVQPGYLRILQMGDTDPKHKSRKTEYELDQSINWQIKSSLNTTHSQSAGGNHRTSSNHQSIHSQRKHQNDTVSTNSNDVAELHKLSTDIPCEEAKSCWLPSRNAFLSTILSWLVPDATLKTQFSTYSNDVASHHSLICVPAASSNHSKCNYCQQITKRHAYVISTDSKFTRLYMSRVGSSHILSIHSVTTVLQLSRSSC
ncbi:translation initiation factor IF-2, chloroplastic [Dorcoceras hygrometricum]|uniref:Translation initiation factor IF-2, chloroplastic n=1 Tax=Dorcoceras hygrometricum TaxID=472368 RepID=A0A2Z7D7X8_9LAMI|nr:translation initiation factor IF-2, chloroplastic [Dorcoceras hygrometricum]